jgi:GAG-pre-integrase domain
LGHWDAAGGHYIGGGGKITLITKDGKHVTQGNKIDNNLYKMKLTTWKPPSTPSKTHGVNLLTFFGSETACSWETWHCPFGHIGYSGPQNLLDKKLVDGFNVDEHTLKPDCVACTEAK